jgi:hypothetical protein
MTLASGEGRVRTRWWWGRGLLGWPTITTRSIVITWLWEHGWHPLLCSCYLPPCLCSPSCRHVCPQRHVTGQEQGTQNLSLFTGKGCKGEDVPVDVGRHPPGALGTGKWLLYLPGQWQSCWALNLHLLTGWEMPVDVRAHGNLAQHRLPLVLPGGLYVNTLLPKDGCSQLT